MTLSPFIRRLILALSAVCFVGCTSLVSTSEVGELPSLPFLPNTQLSRDSVILEVGFVPVPENSEAWRDDVWSELDEQHLDPELRRKLAANGFRCGLCGSQLPMGLRAALDAAEERNASRMDAADRVAEPTLVHRRVQNRSGKRSEVVTCSPRESMVVLLHDEEEVVGRTYAQAQPLMAVRSFPLGDGRARVELTPEIQHGPSRQRWIGQDGAFQLDAGQHSEVFSKLVLDTSIAPGQTLVIAADGPSRSLGGNFFGLGHKDRTEKMLLVRLAQSQYDDLFAPSESEASDRAALSVASEAKDSIGTDLEGAVGTSVVPSVSVVPGRSGVEEEASREEAGGSSSDGLTIEWD